MNLAFALRAATWNSCTRQFKEVKFQSARNNGYLITLKYFTRNGFARVDGITKVVGCS